jgi:dihydroorotase
MSTRPAEIVKLPKGTLRDGADADATIIDPRLEWTVDFERFKTKSCNGPYNGWKLRGRATHTIVGGEVKWEIGHP